MHKTPFITSLANPASPASVRPTKLRSFIAAAMSVLSCSCDILVV